MADEDDGAAAGGTVLHLAHALALEFGIAHREHFVHDEDLRFEVRGHGEAQANPHAAAVAFYRGIDVVLDTAEGDDLVQLGVHLGLTHAEDGAVEVDVVPAGELGMEAGAHL